MLKPVLDISTALKAQQFAIPALVDLLQRKEFQSVNRLLDWLRCTEEILRREGYAQCATLAGLRSKVLAPDFAEPGRNSRRREHLRVAAGTVYEAQDVVAKLLEPMEAKIAEARSIMHQILLIVQPSGLLHYPGNIDFNNFIQGLWHTLKTNEHVGGGISKVLVLVNQSDAIRLLAEEIEITKTD